VAKYLRIVGFLTPVENWPKPRRDEYPKRQFYEPKAFPETERPEIIQETMSGATTGV
jgi:hypothetical protein